MQVLFWGKCYFCGAEEDVISFDKVEDTTSVSFQNVSIHSASIVNHHSIAFFSSSLVSFFASVFLLFQRLSHFDFPIIIPSLFCLFTIFPLILITFGATNSKRIYQAGVIFISLNSYYNLFSLIAIVVYFPFLLIFIRFSSLSIS